MTEIACVPVPAATARTGYTIYERGTGTVLGWVRRAEDADSLYGRPDGTWWLIPRAGSGVRETFPNVHEAAAYLIGDIA